MQQISKDNFKAETSQGVVIVDFSATWCGPCRMLTPVLEQVKNAKVFKVDIDQDQELALQYKVSAVPKIVFMKDGVVQHEAVGLLSREVIQETVDQLNHG